MWTSPWCTAPTPGWTPSCRRRAVATVTTGRKGLLRYPGASPALMGACADRGVELCFFTPHNRFLARVQGETHGSVHLRKTQTLWSEDPCIGFMHEDRSGRASLALDLMEELRAPIADRFVLSLINRRMIEPRQFQIRENGAVLLEDSARRDILTAWQQRKQEVLTHPFLEEKIPWGLVPHVQAQLLSRWMRDDLDGYPPFRWK